MGLFIQGKNKGNRRFSYEPRFYNPEKEERLRRRIQVKRMTGRRRNSLGLIIFGILAAMVFYVYLNLG
ncbi:MAG: hypothetical protein BMS9Abin05_1508 [Rhodothermia bacterium]|nr:MAG: hypothetical protein BMS9Abin05_1508 [Rhodothermia bacterium]